MKKASFTIFKGKPNVAKAYDIIDGQLKKLDAENFYEGPYEIITAGIDELPAVLEKLKPGNFITSGINTKTPKGFGRRTLDDLSLQPEPGLLILDGDSLDDPVFDITEASDYIGKIRELDPALEDVCIVSSSSASSYVSVDGTLKKGLGGQHNFIVIDDAQAIPTVLDILHKRSVLAGWARAQISENGEILIKSLIDVAMKAANQPCFEGGSRMLNKTITQRREILSWPGGALCAADIKPLTETEEMAVRQKEADIAEPWKEIAAEKKASWKAARKAQLIERGATPEEADRVVDHALGGDLYGEHVISTDRQGELNVSDILANRKKYHKQTCADPLEPSYGQNRAIIYSDQDKPVIHSLAHGISRTFFLKPPIAFEFDATGNGTGLPHYSEISIWKDDATETHQPSHLDRFPHDFMLNKTLDFIAASAEDTNPTLNVASVIHLAAITCARMVRSSRNNASALYICQIGRTGAGKNAGKNAVASIYSRVFSKSIPTIFTSGSGLFSLLRSNPAAVMHIDEFGDKLGSAMKDKGGNKIDGFSTLKELYGQPMDLLSPQAFSLIGMSGKQRDEFMRNTAPVNKPHLNLLTVTTPGQLHDALTGSMVEGGLVNRFIWVEACERTIQNKEPEYTTPDWLIEHIKDVRSLLQSEMKFEGNLEEYIGQNDPDVPPKLVEFKFSDFSNELLDAFKTEIRDLGRNDEFYADMSARWRENAMRMALALHVFEQIDVIGCEMTIDHKLVSWSIDYVRFHGKRFMTKLYSMACPSEKYGQRRQAYLLAFRKRPEGTSTHHVGKNKPWKDDAPAFRAMIIKDMLASGEIVEAYGDKPARGPTQKLYFAVS